MSKTHSSLSPSASKTADTRSTPADKPEKPYPEYPLFPHANGHWAKKIRGRLHYFGKWDDPDAALAKYLGEKDDLHAGRTPRADVSEITVKDIANAFLNHKLGLLNNGELSPYTWVEYKTTAELVVEQFGKRRLVSDLRQNDFATLRNKMAAKWGPHRLSKIIQYIRSIFKHGFDAELLDRPIRFGPGFKRPTKKTLRLHRAKQGPKLFMAVEIRQLLDTASPSMKAMILLGINCGFGNADCGNLPIEAIDLSGGWINFPRPKTGIARRCKLWPETIAALQAVLAKRKAPTGEAHVKLVFITKYGKPWAKDYVDSPITKETRKLLDSLGINGHRNFYTLRHTFRTVADEARDQPAADFIMGHESPHMSSVYRERISDERLAAVAEHVRQWLFGEQKAKPAAKKNSKPRLQLFGASA